MPDSVVAPAPLPAGPRAGQPLTTFAIVWATATLIHLASFHFWARTWQGWLLVACVGLTLMRPGSLARFAAMVAVSLCNLYAALPFVPNHILFEGMVNLTILLAIGWVVWRRRDEFRRVWSVSPPWKELAIAVAAVGVYIALMRRIPHEYLGGAGAALLMWLFSRRPGFAPVSDEAPAAAQQTFSGVLRCELVAMYFWAAIQKLNQDYFNPSVSCAVQLQRELEERLRLPASPEAFWPAYPVGSLLIEAGIPLLLCFRRTRAAGFALALLFHGYLAVHPHAGIYSFSALALAMLALFLPDAPRRELHAIWDRGRRFLVEKFRLSTDPQAPGRLTATLFYLHIAVCSVLYSVYGENQTAFHIVNDVGLAAFIVWGLWLGSAYLYAWRKGNAGGDPKLPAFRLSPAWLGLALACFNGLNPWIGLKTQHSFSMFSNLRTEFAPNHLFLRKTDLFDYQREMVEIIQAEPDILATPEHPTSIEPFANPGKIMPFFELRRLLSRVEGDVTMTIRRQDGSTETIERRGERISHPDAFAAPSLLEYKLLWFRRHDAWTGPMPCTH